MELSSFAIAHGFGPQDLGGACSVSDIAQLYLAHAQIRHVLGRAPFLWDLTFISQHVCQPVWFRKDGKDRCGALDDQVRL